VRTRNPVKRNLFRHPRDGSILIGTGSLRGHAPPLAQLYGIGLTLAQQVTVVLICILGGIGSAGVPAGSIPVVVMILGLVGVPAEGIGMIIGVDRFLDMCRTTLNVTGDLAAAVVVSRGETMVPRVAQADG